MATVALAYSHLNLRFNPFREATREERLALAVVDVKEHVEWLRGTRRALQFVGDHGRGKSTHLIALHAHFPGAPFIKIFEGERVAIPDASVIFVDEVEWIPDRRALWRNARSVAFGSHSDRSAELSGFEVRTVPVGALTAERLERIIDRRIEWARRGAGRVPTVPRRSIHALISRHGDDVRAIESRLYDVFQEMNEARDAEV